MTFAATRCDFAIWAISVMSNFLMGTLATSRSLLLLAASVVAAESYAAPKLPCRPATTTPVTSCSVAMELTVPTWW